MNRDRLWDRFMWLLSLDLHDGNEKDAKERPAKNFHGAATSYKKVFDKAWDAMEEEYRRQRQIPQEVLADAEFDVGGEG